MLGLFSNYTGTRLLYILRGVRGSGFLVFLLISMTMLFNAGAPFSYSFFRDFLGVVSLGSIFPYFFLFFMIYYMISYYYSVVFFLRGLSLRGGFFVSPFFCFFLIFIFIANFNVFVI